MRGKRGYGELGEEYAHNLLKKSGYQVIQRNFRCKIGEIDIIAKDKGTLVFVEVKTRWSRKFGKPEEAVTPRKLNKIKRIGEYYLLTHPNLPKKLRIDVVAIEVEGGNVKSARIIKVT